MKIGSFFFLLLSSISFCAWGMKQKTAQPVAVFCSIAENRNDLNPDDILAKEVKNLAGINSIFVATNSITRHVRKKTNFHLFDHNNQTTIIKPTHVDLANFGITQSDEFTAIKKFRNIKTDNEKSFGCISKTLSALFPNPLPSAQKKVFFLTGHGSDTVICGTSEQEFLKILDTIKNVAKLVIVQSCYASKPERLQTMAQQKYPFTLVSTCIGDSVSSGLPSKRTPAIYEQFFSILNALPAIITKEYHASILTNQLNTILDFKTIGQNICQILYQNTDSFQVLCDPALQAAEYALIENRVVLTANTTTNPLYFTDSERLNFASTNSTKYEIDGMQTNISQPYRLLAHISPARSKRPITVAFTNVTLGGRVFKRLRFTVSRDEKTIDEVITEEESQLMPEEPPATPEALTIICE